MNAATRDRLMVEGRTHWFAIKIDVGRRFPTVVHRWARDADHARELITAECGPCVIIEIKEQHR